MSYIAVISYATEDHDRASNVRDELERHEGWAVWMDRLKARENGDTGPGRLIAPGSSWRHDVAGAIDAAAVLIVVDTPASRLSVPCALEHQHATDRGKRIIALVDEPELGSGRPAAVAIPLESTKDLAAAVRDGLELATAHAKATVIAAGQPGRLEESDALLLSGSIDPRLGITVSPAVRIVAAESLKEAKQLRRRRRRIATALMAAIAVFAVVAGASWVAAELDRAAADRAATKTRSLAGAARSEATVETTTRLVLAIRALRLDENEATTAALRSAINVARQGHRVDLRAPAPALAAAVDDRGMRAAMINSRGDVNLVDLTGNTSQRVIKQVDAKPLAQWSPNGRWFATIAGDALVPTVIEGSTGRVVSLDAAAGASAVLFSTEKSVVVVGRSGWLRVFAVAEGRTWKSDELRTDLPGGVRSATFTRRISDRQFTLATLSDDGGVQITPVGHSDKALHVSILQDDLKALDDYRPGWDTIRVCSGQLAVSVNGRAGRTRMSFRFPYTIAPDGRVDRTGSAVSAGGVVCTVDGAAGLDPLRGVYVWPPGPEPVGLVPESTTGINAALASSSSGEWAVVATDGGELRAIRAAELPAERSSNRVSIVVGAEHGAAITGDGSQLSLVGPTGLPQPISGAPQLGGNVRGSYIDAALGSVVGSATAVTVIVHGKVTRSRSVEPIVGIRPGVAGKSALTIAGDRRSVTLLPLDGATEGSRFKVPRRMGADLWDAVPVEGGEAVAFVDRHGLLVVADHDGRVLRARAVGPTGRTLLAGLTDDQLVVATSDGRLKLLDASTLDVLATRAVTRTAPLDLELTSDRRRLATLSIEHEAGVVRTDDLATVERFDAPQGADDISFDQEGRTLFVGSDLPLLGDSGSVASLRSFRLCEVCGGDGEQLVAAANQLLSPRLGSPPATFAPDTGSRLWTRAEADSADECSASGGGPGDGEWAMTVARRDGISCSEATTVMRMCDEHQVLDGWNVEVGEDDGLARFERTDSSQRFSATLIGASAKCVAHRP